MEEENEPKENKNEKKEEKKKEATQNNILEYASKIVSDKNLQKKRKL